MRLHKTGTQQHPDVPSSYVCVVYLTGSGVYDGVLSTAQGSIYAYLVKVPCLCAGWDTRVAHLASRERTPHLCQAL